MREVNIDGLRHYMVSSTGDVFAPHLSRNLKQSDNGLGYKFVKLRYNHGVRGNLYVHRLVAISFLESFGLNEVNHIDGDKANNCVDNLEWCTRVSNMRHASNMGLLKKGATHYQYICENCLDRFKSRDKNRIYCSIKCAGMAVRCCERPTREELLDLINRLPMTEIGRMYYVSDNAVRKWAKAYSIL